MNFEEWWAANFKGKLGEALIEAAFKEVAEKTWEAATDEGYERGLDSAAMSQAHCGCSCSNE